MPGINRDRVETLVWLKALVAAAVLLPLLVYAGAVGYLAAQGANVAALRVERAARVSEEHARKVLETNSALLSRIEDLLGNDSNEVLQRRESSLHTQLARMTHGLPQMQGIFVIDSDGRMVATDRRYPAPRNIDYSDRPSFGHHLSNGAQPYISEALTSRATGELFFDMSVRRSRADGQFGGTLSTSLAPKYFAEFYRELTGDDRELNIALVRADGSVLARWPEPPTASDIAGVRPSRMVIEPPASAARAARMALPKGEHGLLASRPLSPYPIHVVTWMDDEAIRATWRRDAVMLAVWILPVMAFLFLSARTALVKTRRSLEAAERLRAEIRQREMVEETLRQAQKLEAMGRLTGGVAHDFNNLLMIVSNSLFIATRRHPQLQGSPQVAAMERAVAAGAKLTRQLLSFSRRQPFRPELVSLQDRLPAILDLIRPAVGSATALASEVDPLTMPVEVDLAELELALLNLAINAKDAMPDGGKLSITASNVESDDLPAGSAGTFVRVTVNDQGQGISPEHLERVFEPFFTTKPAGHGTGLGLAQVYGFCQRAGGTARVESRQGEGTRVHLLLPAAMHRAVAEHVDAQPHHQPLDLRVLLAEDNADVASATVAVLELLGCQVQHVQSGDEAKAVLDAHAGRFDLVLSDIVMPGTLNGVALGRYVRSTFPDIAVLLMSGYSESTAEASSFMLDVVPKPCTPDVLAAAIKREMERPG